MSSSIDAVSPSGPKKRRRRDTAFDKRTLPAWWPALQRVENPTRRCFHEFVPVNGCRSSSANALRWRDVDLDARAARIESDWDLI